MYFRDWKVAEGARLYRVGTTSLSVTELLAHMLRDVKAGELQINTLGSTIANRVLENFMERPPFCLQ